MDDDMCHLCFEKCTQMQHNFQHTIQNANIQEFIDTFGQFVFQQENSYAFDSICVKCWQTLQQFNQYCERIRSIHRELVDESSLAQKFDDDQTEILVENMENIEEYDGTEQECETTVALLTIETDVGEDGFDTINRRNTLELTPKVIANLEEQLKFEAATVDFADIEFHRFAKFIPMECNTCNLQFYSFDDYNDHYLFLHDRSAVWNCCNLVLETPYDALDHLKYHESVDYFKCAACHKCFLTSNKLKYHIRRTHLPADGSFFCSVCDKECKNLRLLLNHQKSHIQINCPHCKKYITASNYEHHVRTIHACVPTTKRKPTARADVITSKKRIGENPTQQSSSSKMMHPSVRSFNVNNEPKENGMFECDICRMEFKQISLVYSHRNKVHV